MTGRPPDAPRTLTSPTPVVREPSVARSFYPASREWLASMVRELFAEARGSPGDSGRVSHALPAGLLVPHAGLVYSGIVAAAGWSRLTDTTGWHPRPASPPTIVVLGTNHGASWLHGVAAWDVGVWRTPLGDVQVDEELAGAIVNLGSPFLVDRDAHDGEHSIEVQLPLLQMAVPDARIVPLAVSAGTGPAAIEAGRRLGELLADRRAHGEAIVLAISSDMAHYPPAAACEEVTEAMLPPILAVDPADLAAREIAVRGARIPGLVCGMCGIQATVLGLAALRALGAMSATQVGTATSADAGGPPDRTVGYLAVRFDT